MTSLNCKYLFFIPAILILIHCNPKKEQPTQPDRESQGKKEIEALKTQGIKRAFPPRKNEVERATDTLVLFCLENNYEVIASRMLYNGDDASRKWKEVYQVGNGSDYEIVRITADVIKQWVKDAERYAFGKLSEDGEKGMKWQEQEVIFMSRKKVHKKIFSFMMKDGKYYLINIKSPPKTS